MGRWLGCELVVASLAGASLLAVAGPASANVPACNGGNGVTVASLNAPRFYIDSGITPKLDAGYAGYDISASSTRSDLWVKLTNFTGGALGLQATQPASLPLGPVTAAAHTPAYFLLAASQASATAQTHTVEVYSGQPNSPSATLVCSTSGGFSGVDETIKASANKLQDVTNDGVIVTVSTSTPHLGGTVSVTVEGTTGTIGAGTATDPNGLSMTPTALSTWPAAAFRLTGTALKISPDGTAPAHTYSNLLHLAPLGSSARDYTATYTFTITGTTASSSRLFPIQQIASGTQIKHTDTSSFSTLIPAIPAATNPLTLTLAASPNAFPLAGGTSHVTESLVSSASETSTIDQLQAHLPTGVTYVAGTAHVNGTPVADPSISSGTLTFAGPFSAHSGAPATLVFDVLADAGAATYELSGSGLLGATVIDTTTTTTDNSPATASLTVAPPRAQAITFPALPAAALTGSAPTLAATATSGLAVDYASTTEEVCTVSAGVIILVGIGTCSITASQGGDDAWAAATPVTRSFDVSDEAPAPSVQTIDFPTLANVALDATAPVLAATADSGLTVEYASTTEGVCTVDAGVITLVGVGTCSITATQPGDDAWAAATPVTRSFDVTPGTPALPAPPAPQPKTTTGVGISAQTTTVGIPAGGTVRLLVNGSPALSLTIGGQGTYTLDPDTGVITFTPVLGFAGAADPVTYQVTDSDDQTGTATYTPTVTLPTPPPASERTTTGAAAAVQTVTISVPTGGTITLLDNGVPALRVTVPGEGTYELDPETGVITFTPEPGFTGAADPVEYRVTDAYGQGVDSIYTATVVARDVVTSPVPAPTRTPDAAGHRPLAATGLDSALLGTVAALLIAAGSVTCAVSRRRQPRRG